MFMSTRAPHTALRAAPYTPYAHVAYMHMRHIIPQHLSHEPAVALYAGDTGLECYTAIADALAPAPVLMPVAAGASDNASDNASANTSNGGSGTVPVLSVLRPGGVLLLEVGSGRVAEVRALVEAVRMPMPAPPPAPPTALPLASAGTSPPVSPPPPAFEFVGVHKDVHGADRWANEIDQQRDEVAAQAANEATAARAEAGA